MTSSVLELLDSKNIPYQIAGADYLITCLNPEHEDKHPSCRVDRISGVTHCYSCGFKTNIFKYFGLLTNTTSIKVAKLKEKLMDLKISFEGLELPEGATQAVEPYKNISLETLRHFGAFTTYQEDKLADRIVFPIKDIRDKIVVFQGRHLLSDGKPKYINYPKNTELPLYPIKYPGNFTSAVLVEGIFDMLNLYDKGLKNVTCCFGVTTLYKDTSIKLLPLKALGITKIFILFDSDTAGIEAAEKLKPLIEAQDFSVEIISLPEEYKDPGMLDEEYITSINEYVNS